jgi:chromatin segregation and condensation protein Rec8/ScpA/Scc1 (kleisin family)
MTAALEFQVQLPGYAGSLDGLVRAVSRRELSLAELPLGPLAQQLLTFLECQGFAADLDRPMEWAELAARLIRWKTLALLPEVAQQAVAEAELRLEVETKFRELERQRVEHVRDFLVERLLARGGVLETEPLIEAFRLQEPALFPSLWTLRQKFQTLRQRAQQRHRAERVITSLHRSEALFEEMTAWLETRLGTLGPEQWITVEPWFAEASTLPRQIALFEALLHGAHRQILWLKQHNEEPLRVAKRTVAICLDR